MSVAAKAVFHLPTIRTIVFVFFEVKALEGIISERNSPGFLNFISKNSFAPIIPC